MLSKFIVGLLCSAFIVFADDVWVETTQEDFSDGIYERNIYATHRGNGVVEFAPHFDLNNDGYIDLITADRNGPYVCIYWGSATGYAMSNRTLFVTEGAGNCDVADLNTDGFPDLVVTHRFDAKISIYWGSPSGPDPYDYTDIPVSITEGEACFIADFNKDGYLDITIDRSRVGYGAILWGSAAGYSYSNRTDLPIDVGQHNIEVADFNHDTWLDVLFTDYGVAEPGQAKLYWGSDSGFSPANMATLSTLISNHGISIADLNDDQFLDVILTHWEDTRSMIYWGSPSGYSAGNMDILNPGYCYGGSAVADVDTDGYLDIVYHRGGYGIHEQEIYWGSSSGYSDNDTTWFGIPIEATGGFVADLNFDGALDIFCNTITPSTNSYIFWGPSYTTNTSLPVNNDHHAMFREIGNVYDREYYEDYVSSVFDASEVIDWGTLEWDDSLPEGTAILFWVRSGNTPMPDTSWADWYSLLDGDPIPASLDARYLQYKARLTYSNPSFLPSLNEIRITYASSPEILASVRIEPEVINLKSHGKFTAFIILPPDYNPHEIDITTVECEGAPALSGNVAARHFIAKFNVQDLVGISPGPAVEFEVTGQLYDGSYFHGYDTVRVIGSNPTLMCTPNPCKRYTTVTMTNPSVMTDMRVTIYNVCGELVRTLDAMDWNNGVGSVIWDRTDNEHRRVPQGVYLLKTYNDGVPVTDKIVVLSE